MEIKKKEIINFVEEYFKVYFTERNYSKLVSFLSSEMTVIGTGLHEIGRTIEDTLLLFKKDLEEVKSPIEYSNLDININIQTQQFSIVSGDFSIKGESKGISFVISPIRYSFTIRKEKVAWKILHLHISTPNDMQEDGELYPLQKLIKQNKLLNQKVEERTKELIEANSLLIRSNRTKEKLFALIAHDIKSPFNSLLGFIDILKNKYEDLDSKQHKKYINIISDSSKKIYNLADNLLIWSKLQQDMFDCKSVPINLSNTVQKSADIFIEVLKSKKIKFINNIDNSIIVSSDEFMLSTIFRNLISNAIKFSYPESSINIGIVSNNPELENVITVCVEDTGIGISQKQINDLLTSDVNKSTKGTNNEKGTGLGLSLCKEFLNLQGSKFWIESTPNMGSKFYLNLHSL